MASRFDIHIQIVAADKYQGMAFYSFGPDRSIGVRGMQKLVNIFAKYLLTPLGSDPMDLSYGTELPNLFSANVDLNDAKDVLVLAVDKATQAIRTNQTTKEVADDERLASATVTAILLIDSGPGVAAQILIKNVLNESVAVLLPTLEVTGV
jgi:hypothetical protein